MIRCISMYALSCLPLTVVVSFTLRSPIKGSNSFFLLGHEGDTSPENNTILLRPQNRSSLLQEWAVESGIELSYGLQIVDEKLVLAKPCARGDTLINIPKSIILSTDYYDNNPLKTRIADFVGTEYVSECLLMLRLLEESSKGARSKWYPWLQSLPTKFCTGIYFDERERSYVQQMAPEFLEQHMEQWQVCSQVILSLLHSLGGSSAFSGSISVALQDWLMQHNDLEELLKWAFSIVYTTSWKSFDGHHAMIVPLASMLDHNVQLKNLQPCHGKRSEVALDLCLTKDAVEGTQLYISYGINDFPARFLVNFGFVDFSTEYVDAHINVDDLLEHAMDWPPVDISDLVVSTRDGALSEELMTLFLYKVLHRHDLELLQAINTLYETTEPDLVLIDDLEQDAMVHWAGEIAEEAKLHFQSLLDKRYPPMFVGLDDFSNHVNLKLIVEFNLYMRETFIKCLLRVKNMLKPEEDLVH